MNTAAIDRRGQEGQAAVESALVLPLHVFLILGTLQLGLMHQAQLMTKYAAYQAVRAGALNHADPAIMEKAALGVLLPLISKSTGGAEWIMNAQGSGNYLTKWEWVKNTNQMPENPNVKYAMVTICGPSYSSLAFGGELNGLNPASGEIDWDDPAVQNKGGATWKSSERTKLRIQVLFNYRMPIPFANYLIFNALNAVAAPSVTYLGKPTKDFGQNYDGNLVQWDGSDVGDYRAMASGSNVYIAAIRAEYTMRMQSSLYVKNVPGNLGEAGFTSSGRGCVFPFDYLDNS